MYISQYSLDGYILVRSVEEFGIRLRLDLGIADDQQTKLSMCGALKLLISTVDLYKKRSGHPGWDLGEKVKRMEFDLVFFV